jgi:hypothetical protein
MLLGFDDWPPLLIDEALPALYFYDMHWLAINSDRGMACYAHRMEHRLHQLSMQTGSTRAVAGC